MDQRYTSAQELADDLRSHLENRPIKAKPPTTSEIICKWARRNPSLTWAAMITLSLVTMTLAASTALVSKQLARARAAESEATQAKDETTRSADVLARRNYLLHIANADQYLLDQHFQLAQAELDACPPELREWEWSFLRKHLSVMFPLSLHADSCPIFSRDGKRLIAITGAKITTWELATGEAVDMIKHDVPLCHIALSPDEERVFGGDHQGSLCLWDLATGQRLWSVKLHEQRYDGLAISPDGLLVATANFDGKVIVADATTGEAHAMITRFESPARHVAFSPDGRWIASGTISGDEPAILADAATGEIITRFSAEGGNMLPRFAPDGNRIATANADGSIRIWRWDGEQLVQETSWRAAERQIRSIEFSPDGSRLIATDRANVASIWDAATGEKLTELKTRDVVYWSAFSPSGDEVALYNLADGIRIWRYEARKDGRFVKPMEGAADVIFSPDGTQVLVSTPMRFNEVVPIQFTHQPESAVILDADSGEVICSIDESSYAATWTPDGREILATAPSANEIRTYEVATGEQVRAYPFRSGQLMLARVDPSNRRLVSFSMNGTLRVLDFSSGEVVLRRNIVRGNPMVPFQAAAISRDASLIGVANYAANLQIEVWDTQTATLISRHLSVGNFTERLAFSSDGDRIFVAGRGGLLAERHLETQYQPGTNSVKLFLGHRDIVSAIALSPNEQQIVSGDFSGRVVIWDVESGRALVTLADGGKRVTGLDWNSDGRRIAAGKEDGTVQIWTLPRSP